MKNFNYYDERTQAIELLDEMNIETNHIVDLLDMSKLCRVEAWASDNGLIDSEEALSERFDEEIAPYVIERYGINDRPAMREAFNNWSDGLTRDNELHSVQYHEYCYVGEYPYDD